MVLKMLEYIYDGKYMINLKSIIKDFIFVPEIISWPIKMLMKCYVISSKLRFKEEYAIQFRMSFNVNCDLKKNKYLRMDSISNFQKKKMFNSLIVTGTRNFT